MRSRRSFPIHLSPFMAAPILVATLLAAASLGDPGAQEKPTDDPALKRTRKTVQMLDDIYKGGIVAITDNYVNDRDTIPAGTAFKQVFKSAQEKGWHTVRLVDGLNDPLNEENAPIDDFERKALKALVAGETGWYEAVETEQGKRTLRVATAIPVVFEKCVMCHDNYADVPKGQAVGALTYKITIE